MEKISRRDFLKIAATVFEGALVLPLVACGPSLNNSECPANFTDGLNEFMADLAKSKKIGLPELKKRISNQFPSQNSVLLMGESHQDEKQEAIAKEIIGGLISSKKIGQMFYETDLFWQHETIDPSVNTNEFNAWSFQEIQNINPSSENGVVLYAGFMHVYPELHQKWAYNETDSFYELTQKPEYKTLWELCKSRGVNPMTFLMMRSDGVYVDAELDILRGIQAVGLPEFERIIDARNSFECGALLVEQDKIFDLGNEVYIYLSPNMHSKYGEGQLLGAAADISRALYSPFSPLPNIDLRKLRFHSAIYIGGRDGYGYHQNVDYVLHLIDDDYGYDFIFPSSERATMILDIFNILQREYTQKNIRIDRPR